MDLFVHTVCLSVLIGWFGLAWLTASVLWQTATDKIILLILLLAAVIAFLPSPYRASSLPILDSVEHVTMAYNFIAEGLPFIAFEGEYYPVRYPPWFAFLFIAPIYYLFGLNVGLGVYGVFMSFLVVVACIYLIGSRNKNVWGGIFAVLMVLTLGDLRNYSWQAMTDVPAAAATLICLLLFLESRRESSRWALCYGLHVGWSAALRTTNLALLLPALVLIAKEPGQRTRRLVLLVAPTVFMVLLSFGYNYSVFGDPFRNGYHFWDSKVYDNAAGTISPQHFFSSLSAIPSGGPILLLVILAAFQWRTSLFKFTLWVGIPITVFYLMFHFPASRYFLSPFVLLALLAGVTVGGFIARYLVAPHSPILFAACFLLIAAAFKLMTPVEIPRQRLLVDKILGTTEANAVIVSDANPAYLNLMVFDHSDRILITKTREADFANTKIRPRKGEDGRDVISKVAEEAPDLIEKLRREGRAVYSY